jgi:hypothetical protein
MQMIQLSNYTKENFEEDYFHYCFSNNHFTRATLRPELKEFSEENNKNYFSIDVRNKIAKQKLGSPNFCSDWDTDYWIFELNNDIFYYQNDDKRKGSTIGIFCEKKDTTTNWLFEPEEYEYKKNRQIGEKLLNFCKELSDKLK